MVPKNVLYISTLRYIINYSLLTCLHIEKGIRKILYVTGSAKRGHLAQLTIFQNDRS